MELLFPFFCACTVSVLLFGGMVRYRYVRRKARDGAALRHARLTRALVISPLLSSQPGTGGIAYKDSIVHPTTARGPTNS